MSATIKIEFMAGDMIEKAFSEAISLAKKLDIWVEFKFNDVTCIAGKNGTVDVGVKSYHAAMRNKEGSKVAFS